MSQAERDPTAFRGGETDRRRPYPDMTFLDPQSTASSTARNVDILDNAADVVAFLNAALGADYGYEFNDRERCGIGVLLRSVEHTMRQAGTLVGALERDLKYARTGPDRKEASGSFPTYPRFDDADAAPPQGSETKQCGGGAA